MSEPMTDPVEEPIRVQATAKGYYGHRRRKEGDVFEIESEQEFSEKWMRKVGDNVVSSGKVPEEPRAPVALSAPLKLPTRPGKPEKTVSKGKGKGKSTGKGKKKG